MSRASEQRPSSFAAKDKWVSPNGTYGQCDLVCITYRELCATGHGDVQASSK